MLRKLTSSSSQFDVYPKKALGLRSHMFLSYSLGRILRGKNGKQKKSHQTPGENTKNELFTTYLNGFVSFGTKTSPTMR